MKKIFYIIINPFRKLYWFIFRPRTYGVKCLIEYDGKFLFIRNSYGKHGWTFSGGGVHRNETPEEATKREVREELGIDIQNIKKLGEYESTREYKRDIVYCYHAEVPNSDFTINESEISKAEWFSQKDIPEFRSSAVNKILNMYKKLTIKNDR